MKITRISSITGISHTRELDVTEEQLSLYERGMLAQKAFPNLTPSEREFISTGVTPQEWKEYCLPHEEDEEGEKWEP